MSNDKLSVFLVTEWLTRGKQSLELEKYLDECMGFGNEISHLISPGELLRLVKHFFSNIALFCPKLVNDNRKQPTSSAYKTWRSEHLKVFCTRMFV